MPKQPRQKNRRKPKRKRQRKRLRGLLPWMIWVKFNLEATSLKRGFLREFKKTFYKLKD